MLHSYKQFYGGIGGRKQKKANKKSAVANHAHSTITGQSLAFSDSEDSDSENEQAPMEKRKSVNGIQREQARSAEFICSKLQQQLDMNNPFDLDSAPALGNELLNGLRKSLEDWIHAKPFSVLSDEQFKPCKLYTVQKIGDLDIDLDLLQLLKNVQMDKNGFTLSKSPLPRLRGAFTADVLEPKVAGCHDRNDMLPSELEAKVVALNASLKELTLNVTEALQQKCDQLWEPVMKLMDFLYEQLHEFRTKVGAENVDKIVLGRLNNPYFMDDILPFEKLWAENHPEIKKQLQSKAATNTDVHLVDDVLKKYFDFYFKYLDEQSYIVLCDGIVKQVRDYVGQYSACLTDKISHLENASNEADIEAVKQEAISSLSNACTRILENRIMLSQRELSEERKDLYDLCMEHKNFLFSNQDNGTIQGRIERLQKKDVRRQFKKLEQRLAAFITLTRSHLSTLFPTFYMVYLGYLVLNFTIYVTNRSEDKVYEEIVRRHAPELTAVLNGKEQLQDQWRFGMEEGAMNLGSVFAKLFIYKCRRVHQEWEQEKKTEKLLKSIGEQKPKAVEEKPKTVPSKDMQEHPIKEELSSNHIVEPTEDQSVVEAIEIAPSTNEPAKKRKKKKNRKATETSETAPELTIVDTPSDSNHVSVEVKHELRSEPIETPVETSVLDQRRAPMPLPPGLGAAMPLPPGLVNTVTSNPEESGVLPNQTKKSNEILELEMSHEVLRQNYLGAMNHLAQLQSTIERVTMENSDLVKLCQNKDLQIADLNIKLQLLEMRIREHEANASQGMNVMGSPVPISADPFQQSNPIFPAPIGFQRPNSTTNSRGLHEERPVSPKPAVPLDHRDPKLFGSHSVDSFRFSPVRDVINSLGSFHGTNPGFLPEVQHHPAHSSSLFANSNSRRPSRLNHWGVGTIPHVNAVPEINRAVGSGITRCSNCGQSGHSSQQCRDGCRYCGSADHLSEICDKV